MSKVIAYLRVSKREQAESGLGLDAQLSLIKTRLGEPDMIFRDEGVSGKIPNRRGLMSAIENLVEGDTLAIAKMDRLARDMFLQLWIEKEVAKKKATIKSCTIGESADDDNPVSKLMTRIVSAFAEYERSLIAERTSSALKQKKIKGEKTGGYTPYGFKVVEVNNCKYLKEDSDEQGVIKYINIMREHFDTSYSKIANSLNNQNVPTKTGFRWRSMTVKRAHEDSRSRAKTIPAFRKVA